MRMFSILASSALSLFLFPTLPVFANPESCLNTQLQRPDLQRFKLDKATHILQVEHHGFTYHWVELGSTADGLQDVPAVVVVNDNGFCDLKAIDGTGDMTKEDYEKTLGVEVHNKFVEAFPSKTLSTLTLLSYSSQPIIVETCGCIINSQLNYRSPLIFACILRRGLLETPFHSSLKTSQ